MFTEQKSYGSSKIGKAQHGWLEIFVQPSAVVKESSSGAFSMTGGI